VAYSIYYNGVLKLPQWSFFVHAVRSIDSGIMFYHWLEADHSAAVVDMLAILPVIWFSRE